MRNSTVQKTVTYFEDLAKGRGRSEIESLTLESLKLLEVQEGFILCKFIVPNLVSDGDGNWHVGAIAAAMDAVGAAAVYTIGDGLHVSVDFNVSYYSTAKIQEAVRIEAKVVGANRDLKSSVIEVRRKSNGELVALGRLWMAPININLIKNVPHLSKL